MHKAHRRVAVGLNLDGDELGGLVQWRLVSGVLAFRYVRILGGFFGRRGALGSGVTGTSPVTWGRVTGMAPQRPCYGTALRR